MVSWSTFVSALGARGMTFDSIRLASDRVSVIKAMGFADALDVAVLETEWQSRCASADGRNARKSDPTAASRGDARAQPTSSAVAAPALRKAAAYHAARPEALADMPEELQEAVVADEVVHVLRGFGGSLITIGQDHHAVVSRHVPDAIAALITPVINVCASRHTLADIEQLELVDHPRRSRVKNAVAEAVREIGLQFTKDVVELSQRCRAVALPLARLVAEAHIVCYPVRRAAQVFDDIAMRHRKPIAELSGDVILNDLQTAAVGASGNPDDARLLGYLVRRAARPYIAILESWMCRGELDDPLGEFFVVASGKPARDGDALAAFMDRFTCARSRVAKFLEPVYRLVFHAGRYCMLLRENHDPLPNLEQAAHRLTSAWVNSDELEATVREIHDAASREVMSVLVTKCQLVERLNSIKSFMLHGRGDWLENFMEAAGDVLQRSAGQVRTYSLNVVLQAEIAKACGSDPYHSAVRFAMSDFVLSDVVSRIRQADPTMQQVIAGTQTVRHSVRRSGGGASMARQDTRHVVELMQLQIDTDWLLSLVINAPFVAKLNIIFRLLLWCKLCERDLNEAWWRTEHRLPKGASLRFKMLQFVRQYFFYAVHHILDPAWHTLQAHVTAAAGIRDVSSHISAFCDDAFRGLAVKSEHAFDALSSILRLCNRFADLGRMHQPSGADDSRRAALRARVDQFDQEFDRLLASLGDPNERDYGRLVPLLSWLDFSGFYARQNIYHVRMGAAAHDELRDHEEHRRSHSNADDRSSVGGGRASSAASSVA